MASPLNIDDEATVQMAHDLAKAKGLTATDVIKAALEREMRERSEDRGRRLAEIDEIVAEFQRNMPPEWIGKTSKELIDAIYDEDGLPI